MPTRRTNASRRPPAPGGRGVAALLTTILLVGCTDAPPEPTDRAATTSAPPSVDGSPAPVASPSIDASASPDIGAPIEPGATSVQLTPPPGGSFLVRGRYPRTPTRCRDPEPTTLTGRFPGTLHVRRVDDGTLTLTIALPFDRYLEGIAEVPSSWPRAALDAQAIAARSYALATTGWSGAEGDSLGQAICATASCQVYRGIPVSPDPTYRRWVRAVRRTDGLVLLDEGRPATTVYYSTSNGRTYGNEDVFGSPPLPYLRPVVERDDGASPTSRWRVRLPFDDLTHILRAAGSWPRDRTIVAALPVAGGVRLRGGDATRTISADDLRAAVNTWAPCLEPASYPPRIPGGRLPLTIPSHWLAFSAGDRSLLVTGRGWGHGVGMVQWGAYGKAGAGRSAEEILAFYYGGLRPRSYPQPGLIRVEVATGLVGLRLVASGAGAEIDGRPVPRSLRISGRPRLRVRG
ncbi:MAG TPA: SpoIID/LytB domain-containing protein [Actinomycetota bacterium]|nr:SpoIID/LytB domain-containing protein [Actinomycetota bacterium]